jgi:hypothetical protein
MKGNIVHLAALGMNTDAEITCLQYCVVGKANTAGTLCSCTREVHGLNLGLTEVFREFY